MQTCSRALPLVCLLIVVGCVNLTFKVYFSPEQVEQAAERIEDAARPEAENSSQSNSSSYLPPGDSHYISLRKTAPAGQKPTLSLQNENEEEENEEESREDREEEISRNIEQVSGQEIGNIRVPESIDPIVQRRAKRWPHIRLLFDRGLIGETRDAGIAVHEENVNNLGLRERQNIRQQIGGQISERVREERNDRQDIITELMKANDVPRDEEERQTFQTAFRRVNYEKAQPGWYLENPDGEWIQKSEEQQQE